MTEWFHIAGHLSDMLHAEDVALICNTLFSIQLTFMGLAAAARFVHNVAKRKVRDTQPEKQPFPNAKRGKHPHHKHRT